MEILYRTARASLNSCLPVFRLKPASLMGVLLASLRPQAPGIFLSFSFPFQLDLHCQEEILVVPLLHFSFLCKGFLYFIHFHFHLYFQTYLDL